MQESIPVGSPEGRPIEVNTGPPTTSGSEPLDDPRALQILSTEHWSLLASRSLSYNEAFSRAGMFLSFLSATLIVIGFLVGSQGMTTAVVPVALVLLAADLFIGLATLGRLIDAGGEELQCIRGMNRIRHAYREVLPGLEPYFVTGFHDDARGVLATYGYGPSSSQMLPNIAHGFTTTVGMVGVIDTMIIGAIAGIISLAMGAPLSIALLLAVAAFAVGFMVFAVLGMRTAMSQQARAESRFPSPEEPRS